MKQFLNLRALAVGIALVAFTSCTNESNAVPSAPQSNVFLQLDRVGRPGIKEIFEPFNDHSTSNRAIPSNDPILQQAIAAFLSDAGQTNTTAVTKLAVDELQINLGGSGNASYLAIETNGAGFGGRGLTDDVMSTNLNVAYGSQFGGSVVKPCVVTDNVGAPAALVSSSTGAFPYLATPQ